MDNSVVVSLRDIVVEFDGQRILDGLNLDIHDKEFVTLLGSSGCGKTTTLRLIAGFLEPNAGKVLLKGEDITGVPPYKRPVNTVFQKYALFPHLNVFENVAFGLRLKKMDEETIRRKVRDMLEVVGLKGFERRSIGQMSGGHMSIEMRMEKTLKSNSKKEVTALDVIVNDAATGALPYMSRSGGERVKAALSVILALAELKSSTAGVQLGFLFIDEPPFLDDKGVEAYCDALEAIQKRYSSLKIMAITHDPEMKARFPQAVDVVKTAEGSKVIYS